jgi:pimeloyl-ACP methyl ester carboxylesterase
MSARPCALLLLALPLYSGCAAPSTQSASALLPPECARGVVFCADGAGGLGGTTDVLAQVIAEERLPLRVQQVDWSHGQGRFLLDHLHWKNIERRSGCLAKEVQAWRSCHPGQRIYLVGQSAGSAVVLEAASALPPGSVERIVLLAPSVSACYDLRPALRCARQGIDVFYSDRDWFVLGLGMAFSGTTDRRLAPAAGRVGFCHIVTNPGDEALYERLRQHPWGPGVAWTGHTGGHYGADAPEHVRACILPLFRSEAAPR